MVEREGFEPAVLGEVDVLIFVGVHPIEFRGPAVAIFFVAEHGEGRPEQEIAEIGGVRLAESLLIVGVDPHGGAKPGRIDLLAVALGARDFGVDPCRRAFGRHEIIFEFRDPVAHDLERIAAGFGLFVAAGEIERLHGALDDAPAVVGVENVEIGLEAGDFGDVAQLPRGEAVVGAEPARRGLAAEGGANARGHLARRLVREGHGKDARGGNAVDGDAVDDGGRETRCLAGAGAGEHEDRARMRRRLDLGLRQVRSDRLEGGVGNRIFVLHRGDVFRPVVLIQKRIDVRIRESRHGSLLRCSGSILRPLCRWW